MPDLRLVSMTAENVKVLKAVRIEPQGSTLVIGGRNGAGKSTVLDSIMYALAGGKSLPEMPIRRGQTRANIVLDLGSLRVERKFTARGSTIVVRGTDQREYTNPQQLLDDLWSKMGFDPLAFTRMSAKQQADILRQIVGLDFTELDEERKRTYEERTQANRALKTADAHLQKLPYYSDAPAVEVGMAEAVQKLSAAEAANLGRRQALEAVEAIKREGNEINRQRTEIAAKIADLRRQIEDLERQDAALEMRFEQKKAEHKTAKQKAESLPEEDTTALREWVSNLEETNRKVRANSVHAAQKAERDRLQADWERLNDRIAEIDAEKAQRIREAPYPIPDLGLNDSGVTYRDLPFEQASSAEQLRVSLAIALALNTELRVVLIRDGSLLDNDSLQMVAEMAEAAGAQVLIERVGVGEEVQVIIEDGQAWDAQTGECLDGSRVRQQVEEMLVGAEEAPTFASAMGLNGTPPADPELLELEMPSAYAEFGDPAMAPVQPVEDDPFQDE